MRTLFSRLAVISLLIVLIGGFLIAGNIINEPTTPEYTWTEARGPLVLGWRESGRTSELLGELGNCYLVGAFNNEYIVCPTEELALIIATKTDVPVLVDPTFSLTNTPRPDDDETPTKIIIVVVTETAIPTDPPTQTATEPTATQVTSTPEPTATEVTPPPTDPPTPDPTDTPEPEKECKNKNSGKDGTPKECNAGIGQEKHNK